MTIPPSDFRFSYDIHPNIIRSDAAIALIGEWTVASKEHQRAAIEASISAWGNLPMPEGFLSYHPLLSNDGNTMLHYSQWGNEEAFCAFEWADFPERMGFIGGAVRGIELHRAVKYRLYRSILVERPPRIPECVVIVKEEFESPKRALLWIDAVFEALEAENEMIPGLVSAHFHISADGTKVMNYAEWQNEEAHRKAIEDSPGAGIAKTNLPEWQRVQFFPGKKSGGSVKRYERYGSLSDSITLDLHDMVLPGGNSE